MRCTTASNNVFTENQKARNAADNAKFAALQQRLCNHLISLKIDNSTVVVKEASPQPVKPSKLKEEKANLKKAGADHSDNSQELKISIGDFQFIAIASRVAGLTDKESKKAKQADNYSITAVHVPKALYSAQQFDDAQIPSLSQMVKILVEELKIEGRTLPKQFEFGDGSVRYSDEFKNRLQNILNQHCSSTAVVIDFKESPATKKTIPSTGTSSRGVDPGAGSPNTTNNVARKMWEDGRLGLWPS